MLSVWILPSIWLSPIKKKMLIINVADVPMLITCTPCLTEFKNAFT